MDPPWYKIAEIIAYDWWLLMSDLVTNRKVVDNVENYLYMKLQIESPVNISGKFEASILKTFREKSFLAHIDCSQIEKWFAMN